MEFIAIDKKDQELVDNLVLEREKLAKQSKSIFKLLKLYCNIPEARNPFLSTRLINFMNLNDIPNVQYFSQYTEAEIRKYRTVGNGTINEIKEHLNKLNLDFKIDAIIN